MFNMTLLCFEIDTGFSLPQFTAFFADEDTTKPLNILHDIISKFDQLMYEAQFNRIEKIKIIQSTFMAACGLLSGRYIKPKFKLFHPIPCSRLWVQAEN